MSQSVSQSAAVTYVKRRASGNWRAQGHAAWIPAVLLSVLLACLVLPPILVLIDRSFRGEQGALNEHLFTFDNYLRLLSDPTLYISAANSMIFAACATVISLSIGGVLAWIVERSDAPFKKLAYFTAIVSLGTPYILYVSSWLFLLGRVGPVNDLYRAVSDTTDILFNVYSLTGMILVEGLLWSPLVFLLLSTTFRRANAEMEEAARMAGASVPKTVWSISMRLAWPAILGLGMFVFIRNIESFDVPVLIGTPSHINLLTTDIYLSLTRNPPQLGYASAFSAILLVIVAVLLYFYGRISRSADRYASVTGKGFRPRPFKLGRVGRMLGGLIILVNCLLVLVLPLGAIVWNSLTPFTRAFSVAGFKTLSLEHYIAVVSEGSYLSLGLNTVLVSASAATAAILLTVLAGWLSVRRWPGSQLLEQLSSVPLVFPGVVLGTALIQVALSSPIPVYGTLWLIGIAFLIRYLPYGMRYSFAGVMQIHRELEEAAAVSGASQKGTLRRVVLPLLAPSMVAGWLFIFLLGAKELSLAVLLAGADSQTMAVAMFDQWSNGQAGEAAALGVVWTCIMSVFALVFYYVNERQGRSEKGNGA
ncbi:iron ABC transporter permease [Herbaspirillum lusitanum]|uniref:Iron ABC transporter permease n=1 Tax=Herbaspirillum lusitanum TaxID=213312 RepID=A0ABW9ABS8_9BURK